MITSPVKATHVNQLQNLRRAIGQCIFKARWHKGMTLCQLAQDLDETVETLDKLEIGNGRVSLELLTRIAVALEVSLADLVKAGGRP